MTQKVNQNEMPRERLLQNGAKALSVAELLAILLKTGTADESVLKTALSIQEKFGSLANMRQASVEELCALKGIGLAKAATLQAAIELGYRYMSETIEEFPVVRSLEQIAKKLLLEMRGEVQEQLVALYLNRQNKILKQQTIFLGTMTHSVAHPREILKEALKCSAASFILAHNHPSGDVVPSEQDLLFTERIEGCAALIGIDFVDHLILGNRCYYSLREKRTFKQK